MIHPATTRAHAARLIADGCTIAEAARTVGAGKTTVGAWFPDAPRLTRRERSEWANYCKRTRAVLAPNLVNGSHDA